MISIGQAQITSSKSLNSFGSINDPSRIANLLLQSSFDTCTILGGNTEPYLGGFTDVNGRNVATYVDLTPKDNSDGSRIWIETGSLQAPHTGTKCLGFRSDKSASYGVRSCLQLTHLDGSSGMGGYSGLRITGDFYVSEWLYYPANWSIPPQDPVGHYYPNWSEVVNLYELSDTDAVNPKLDIHIHRRQNGVYYLELEYERANGADEILWNMIDPFDITTITGKWTHWAYFLHRSTDSNVAYAQVWLNDNLLGTFNDANGSPSPTSRSYHFYTMNKGLRGNTIWLSIPMKTYLDGDGVNYHYLWADDLEVWDGIP